MSQTKWQEPLSLYATIDEFEGFCDVLDKPPGAISCLMSRLVLWITLVWCKAVEQCITRIRWIYSVEGGVKWAAEPDVATPPPPPPRSQTKGCEPKDYILHIERVKVVYFLYILKIHKIIINNTIKDVCTCVNEFIMGIPTKAPHSRQFTLFNFVNILTFRLLTPAAWKEIQSSDVERDSI